MDSVLVFDLWGDYAHYRKIYSTTSSMTFPFPPRSTLIGIIAAILGLRRHEYPNLLTPSQAQVALTLQKAIKTTTITIKLAKIKSNQDFFGFFQEHMLIPFEFVKMPRYRLYVHLTDEKLYETLKTFLIQHKSVYTISLGLSELLANFAWVGEFTIQEIVEKSPKPIEINSIAPANEIAITPSEKSHYLLERMSRHINTDRISIEFRDYIAEANAKPIYGDVKHYWQVSDNEGKKYNIMFL